MQTRARRSSKGSKQEVSSCCRRRLHHTTAAVLATIIMLNHIATIASFVILRNGSTWHDKQQDCSYSVTRSERQDYILLWWSAPLRAWPKPVVRMLLYEINRTAHAEGFRVKPFRSWQKCAYEGGSVPNSRTSAASIFDVNPHFHLQGILHFLRTLDLRQRAHEVDSGLISLRVLRL